MTFLFVCDLPEMWKLLPSAVTQNANCQVAHRLPASPTRFLPTYEIEEKQHKHLIVVNFKVFCLGQWNITEVMHIYKALE